MVGKNISRYGKKNLPHGRKESPCLKKSPLLKKSTFVKFPIVFKISLSEKILKCFKNLACLKKIQCYFFYHKSLNKVQIRSRFKIELEIQSSFIKVQLTGPVCVISS